MNRSFPLAALGLLIAASTSLAGVAATSESFVILRVAPTGFVVPNHWLVGNPSVWVVDPASDSTFNKLPGVAGCGLLVPDADGNGRVSGGEVLDKAVATGCIEGWEYEDFGFGRFVTCVDGLCQVGWPVSWWFVQRNGVGSPVGVDDMDLQNGDSLELIYNVGP